MPFFPSASGYRDDRFLDLRYRVVTKLLKLEMREVGHLVGSHDAIDDRRPIGLERLVDLGVQLAGLRRPKSMAAARAGERAKVRIGEFDCVPVSG